VRHRHRLLPLRRNRPGHPRPRTFSQYRRGGRRKVNSAVDLGRSFPVSAVLPLSQAGTATPGYRMVIAAAREQHLGRPLNLQATLFSVRHAIRLKAHHRRRQCRRHRCGDEERRRRAAARLGRAAQHRRPGVLQTMLDECLPGRTPPRRFASQPCTSGRYETDS